MPSAETCSLVQWSWAGVVDEVASSCGHARRMPRVFCTEVQHHGRVFAQDSRGRSPRQPARPDNSKNNSIGRESSEAIRKHRGKDSDVPDVF